MKKFTEGVRCKLEIIGTCAIMLVSSVLSSNALQGNDDKAKKEVKLVNTFVENEDDVKALSDDFIKISAAVDRYMSVYGTYTTSTTTTTTSSTTSTTVLTTTTVSATTATETTTIFEEKEKEEIVVDECEADTNEYEQSDNSESECNENQSNDECVEEVAEDIVQPSGDITDYISESDYILLCNAVGHEYGSDWVSIQEKALVVEVIMNRVNSARFPGTVYDVLTQPYQFSGAWGYVNLGCFSYQVTQSVKDSVLYYFQHPDEFTHGYLSFNGDGYRNYFR